MKYYKLSVQEVLKSLKSREFGLTNDEVEKRLRENGENKLVQAKRESWVVKFLREFNDLMIIILLIATIVSFVISVINKESIIDSVIIIAIVIINAILGFIQEMKADMAIESLRKQEVTKAVVKRNNVIMSIDSCNIVKGDILVLESGDVVPADARIIWEVSLKVDESSLTGESVAVSKNVSKILDDTVLAMRRNMIYSGTSIVYGKCLAVVCEVGMNTEIGKIASSLNSTKKDITPLQKRINEISKFLSFVIALIIVLMFVVGILKGMKLTEVIMLSISLAVAAIPEGLPSVITIILSLGMGSMALNGAIVRKMSSVETLGCTEVICSDKTGTITKNKMKVMKVFFDNRLYDKDEVIDENILMNIMVLNNDSNRDGDSYIGDPTEIALYDYCSKYIDVGVLRNKYKRVGEVPFDSNRKMMSTVNVFPDGIKLLTKGSFDSVISKCSRILDMGEIREIDGKRIEELKRVEKNFASDAYRILAYAYRDVNEDEDIGIELEDDLIFVGMSAMIDPERDEVRDAILMCKEAHIKTVMITGDSLDTAKAIAKRVGILESDNEAILGSEIDKYNSKELKEVVKNYSVYARVSPINKLEIVNAWRDNGKVVAMTGDGVNDAPALKSASIGVGMGITGTEVSKGVADIILSDDSFSTIVKAVKEGRRIFDNIRGVLIYLLTGNLAEILIVFIGMLFGVEIFLPIQLLYINLITDSIPAIALAFEKADNDIMRREVRQRDSSFFTDFLIARMIFSALLKTGIIFSIYVLFNSMYNSSVAETMTFLTLILLEMIFSYSCRKLKISVLNRNIFSNKYLNRSMLLLVGIQVIIFMSPIKGLFGIVNLNFWQVGISFILVILFFVICEGSKGLFNKLFKDY